MKSIREYFEEARKKPKDPCWKNYRQLGTKKKNGKEVPNCIPEDEIMEAEYQGKKVTLNKPFRNSSGDSKFSVYTKNDKGNVVKVNFGDGDMSIKKSDPSARKNFRARHNCADPGPKWKARYWSCRSWSDSGDWV